MVELTIVILNYQTYELTMQCIASILQTQLCNNYRIIIVDDCSPNNSIEKLSSWIETLNAQIEIKLVRTTKNGGYSAALNKGILESERLSTEYIAIINNDLIFTKDYFSILLEAAVDNPEIAIWGGSIQGKDGGWQVAYKLNKRISSYIFTKKPFLIFHSKGKFEKTFNDDCQNIIRFNGMVSGCCFMFHLGLIKRIGMWDEQIYLNHEEDAIAAKLSSLGLQCAIVPRATLIHLGSQTIGARTPFQYYHRYISEIYVLKTYYNAKSWQLWLITQIDIIALYFNIRNREIRKSYMKNFIEYYKSLQ